MNAINSAQRGASGCLKSQRQSTKQGGLELAALTCGAALGVSGSRHILRVLSSHPEITCSPSGVKHACGVSPSTLSVLICGVKTVRCRYRQVPWIARR